MILLVLVAALWMVVLAPSALRRLGERHGAGSIDHFHHQLRLLEHAGPKLVAPAYRLRTAQPGSGSTGSSSSIEGTPTRAQLVLLRRVDDGQPADIDGKDGVHYERVGVLKTPEPQISVAQTRAELAAFRRVEARRRCTMVFRLVAAAVITTGIVGGLPSLHLVWIFTGIAGVAALALLGLISYAKEIEMQRQRRRPMAPALIDVEHAPASNAAHAGYPGAWDEEEYVPRHAASGR